MGPLPLNARPLPLPNGKFVPNPTPGNGAGLDWVGDELKKYTPKPMPKNAELGARQKTR